MIFRFEAKMVRFPLAVMGFVVVLCLSAAVTEADYVKYKDPKQPLRVRINDLLSRMTLEEKIGQMTQIERVVASPDVMKNYFIGMQSSFIYVCTCFYMLFLFYVRIMCLFYFS